MAIGPLFDCTWGRVRLWCSEITTSHGRTQVVHELAEGDDHVVQDRGLAVRRVRCELLFVEMPRETTTALERLQQFVDQVDTGERLLFVHPFEGSYYVNVEAFDYTIDEDTEVATASASFVKSADADSPQQAGSSTAAAAGSDAVEARAEEFNSALADTGIESAVADDAVASQAAWLEADEVSSRQVLVDVAGFSDALGAFIEDERLEHDLSLFEVYRSSILLGASMRNAALAALASTPKLTSVRIGAPVSLLALCVSIYGGAEAEQRVRQILELNDIRTPGWMTAGITITIPVPARNGPMRTRAA